MGVSGTADLLEWYDEIKDSLHDGLQDLNLTRYFNYIIMVANKPRDIFTPYVNQPLLPREFYKEDAVLYSMPVSCRDAKVLDMILYDDNPEAYKIKSKEFSSYANKKRSETQKENYKSGKSKSGFKNASLYCDKRCTVCGATMLNVRTNKRICPTCGGRLSKYAI